MKLAAWISVITTAVTVIGLGISVWQYAVTQHAQREKDRQAQIRAELDILIRHPKAELPTPSQIVLSLDNLYSLTAGNQAEIDVVTDIFDNVFTFDFLDDQTFGDQHVRFENIVNDYWPDYRKLLAKYPDANARLIRRYIHRIEAESNDSLMFESLQGALFRHGKRLTESASSPQVEAIRKELFPQINRYLAHNEFVGSQVKNKPNPGQ